jgi:protein CpxP
VSAFAFSAAAQDQPAKPGADAKGIFKEKRPGGMRGERMGHRGHGFGLRGIDLTDAQKEQIRQIREANKPGQALRDEMKALREARRNGGTITEDQKARLKALRDETQANMKSVHEQILAVLTAEQRAQLDQRRQQMQQRMQERRQKMEQRRELRKLDRSKDSKKDTTKVT